MRPLVFVWLFEGSRKAMVCLLITNSTAPRCVASVIPAGMKFSLFLLPTKKKKKPGEIGKKIAKIFQVDCLCAATLLQKILSTTQQKLMERWREGMTSHAGVVI